MKTLFHVPMPWGPRAARHPLLILASVVTMLVTSCTQHGSPTSPYGGGNTGGGGGGTAPTYNFGPFALGQSAQLTFPNAGTFGYHCTPHRAMGMVGTVQVDATGADSMLVAIGASGFSFTPSAAHIRPGAYVRWVNSSNLTVHTVTSD